ncbi:hypothetical protein BJ875DRAFT_37688 [Amylocarpus encephaloides]|uniref:Uncharacterized protein n=1 Tax=Amylocarpus encephaloides TaxID=45428 RepID=A0A9P7YI69_9HELO|nr:hypothetical protein BJ875DRAFT_37688 [Amylocarpus encephaloides]
MAPFSLRQLGHSPAQIPVGGLVVSAILHFVTIVALVICLVRRLVLLRNSDWRRIPLVRWLIFVIYIDSLCFIIGTAVLTWGFGLNKSLSICRTAIYLCLACYLTTKMLIYYFLVEKVFIVRSVSSPRLKSKLYCFNCFGLLVPYAIIVTFNFIYRIAHLTPSGTCIIGMELKVLMPLIIFDAIINLYLTMLFVIPLRKLYSYKASPDSKLRTVALRSFIGSCCTLTSSIVNLTVLMVLRGEASWICLICCNADILFSVLMLHWVTSKDGTQSQIDPNSQRAAGKASSSHKLSVLKMYGKGSINGDNNATWEGRGVGTTTSIRGGINKRDPDSHEFEKQMGGISVNVRHSIVVERDNGSLKGDLETLSLGGQNSAGEDSEGVDSVKSRTKSWFEEEDQRKSGTGVVGQVGAVKNNRSTEDLVDSEDSKR